MASESQLFISPADSWELERRGGFLKIEPGWGLWLEQNLVSGSENGPLQLL